MVVVGISIVLSVFWNVSLPGEGVTLIQKVKVLINVVVEGNVVRNFTRTGVRKGIGDPNQVIFIKGEGM